MYKLSFKEKLAYGFGDIGCNFVWTTVSSFLTYYYTNSVAISAIVAGNIMLITRLLDGVSDLLFGTILDRTKSRWGKARPWVLWSTPMMALGLILLFNVPVFITGNAKIAYAAITYIFTAAVAYTASNLSYNALLSRMTDDQMSKTSASSIRFFCTFIAMILIPSITMPIVNHVGWAGTSVIYAAAATICFLITFLGTKERYEAPIKKEKDELPVLEGFKYLFKNKYFIPTCLFFVFFYIAYGTSTGIAVYYAREVFHNENLLSVLTIANFAPMFVLLPVFTKMSEKYGKVKTMTGFTIVALIGCVIMAFGSESLPILMCGLLLKSCSNALFAGIFALTSDGVVYGEWKNGVRQDGLFNSATSFGMKVGTGLGTAFVGWGLAFGKYDAALAVQGSGVITMIKVLYIYIPMISFVILIFCLKFIDIDKIYPRMIKDLEERRNNNIVLAGI